jgi:catechol 2,3-dioxygenase-like lactoylglutathione lyase family enzyme
VKLHGVLLNALDPERLRSEQAARFGPLGALGLELRYRRATVDDRPQHPGPDNPGYWKVGVLTSDVDALSAALVEQGLAVSEPRQFRDIGYLCHFQDSEGNAVELLQHTFAGAPKVPMPPTRVGHVTLRVRDPQTTIVFYRERLGMRLLSVQPVTPHRFTLYFLGSTDECPPLDDPEAVQNREWLWQRPYPCLELQHRWDATDPYDPGGSGPGFAALVFRGTEPAELKDPDGYRVLVERP